ncbi:MAG: putative enoyl-CoA hydratase echA8 [Burkholderiaceae bacterium]|nr:putative enoyl-CoA hydratase echA8 [Burkholderiaceae bacterium]
MKYAQYSADDAVSIVTLNRPERLNAIGSELLRDLHEALVRAQNDPSTRAIVLAGAGRAFCAGDDLKEFAEQTRSPASIVDTCQSIQQITRDIMFGPKLVIGAVQGFAVGGGFEWVLNCDMVVAADDLVCFFPEMSLGHFVTGGVTHLLPRAVGHQRAVELMVLGERQSAADLRSLGLVNRIVPREQLMDAALELAKKVASRSAFATTRLKRVLTMQLDHQLASALELERQAAVECFGSEDTAARITRFAEQNF